MKKKIISILILITIIGVFVVNHLITYANTDEIKDPLYVNLAKTVTRVDEEGNTKHIGYSISEPGNDVGGQAPYIWNIIPHNKNANGTYEISTEQRNLYCVKATYGQTWFDEEEEDYVLEYNLYYDLQEDRDAVLNGLSKVTTNDDVVEKLLTPGEGKYEQLLWLLDNSYIEGQDIDKYFENVGIVSELNNGQIIYYDKDTNDELGTEPLTPTDIIAIQKMAIWYFTDGQEIKENNAENIYNKLGKYSWLFMTEDGQSYELLNDSRNKMAMYLYNYLIRNAENNKSQYNALNNYNINIPPVSVNTTGLETKGEGENTKYVLKTTRVGANYLVGPIKIEEKGKLNYNIQLEVDGLEKGRDYKYTDINGNELTSIENQNDLVGIDGGFYICLSREINSIDISIKISYIETDKTIWLKGDENGTGADKTIELHNEQPLVEIVPKTNDITVNLTSEPDEFDLALRKYVTAVHDKDGNQKTITNPRNLNDISLDTLLTGTTATYKHRKDPVVVEENDIVTYTIRIYNEGNREGYATKIVDQLPAGLIRANDVSEVVSKDKNGNNKNTYTLENSTTLATTNQIVLTIKNTAENPAQSLQPYEIGTLDYETIEIKCKVIKEAHTTEQIILTNVAWIAEAFDSESGETIPTESGLIDRDSQPQTSPDVNKDNMENYTGNDSNKNELNDDTYHYEGKQDDDDFEKLVIMPVEKVFDLALFKHIAAISKDQTIEPGEYVTDTGNIDGTYLRAPVVTAINPETGKITYEQDDKEALTVEPGDYVLYTIRVYNEGEVDGYATKIEDKLPIGLEFVVENEEYNGIWNLEELDSEGRQIVSTTWYAKGNGAEADAVQGDSNYKANLLKALNKEGEISNENPDYIDAQVLCKVVEQATSDRVLVNYAQISDDSDENGDPIEDVDSTPDVWIDEDDDQDIERIKLQCFDLSLRKFISSINGIAPSETREPDVDVSKLVAGDSTTAIYNHPKTPIAVQRGDKVIYTIRVYNEGDINGYASEVKDYLPPYLTFATNSEINTQYGWNVSDNGRIATTTYLANKELQGFNGTALDYEDLKIECIVSGNAPLKQRQTNIAEISEYTYNGNTVDKDIDSTSDNMVNNIPTDENLPSYKDEEIGQSYVPGNEDDDDFEKIYVKSLDLSLRKFVNKVNGEAVKPSREPVVDVTPLKNGTGTTAIYKHPKTPVALKAGDKVIYTIRVYNEGEINGYANEVKDYLPPYLEFVENSSINTQYGWNISEDGRIATTTYLSNKEITAFNGTTLDYEDLQIECKIAEDAIPDEKITNIAEISEYKYGDTVVPEDIDSESDNIEENIPEDENLPDYKEEKENDEYVPGNEDDDDFEKVYVKEFDLALRKFITKIQEKDVTTRIPQVKIENGVISYEHPKEPITVHVGDTVIYTLRIYNEGEIDGYASEITDDIPEYLEYLPEESTNKEYMWKMYDENGNETENVEQAVKVKTTYLSKENGEDNLLNAFDGTTLDYKEIKIAFKVKDPNSNTEIITNHAQISEDTDEDGNSIQDKDSETDEWIEGEDDQDIENVKVEYFDLSILKFVSKVIVIEDGKEKITETGYNGHENPEPVVKVELHKKKLQDVIVKFGYGITVTNEGDIPGYATELTDYVPEGLRFEAADNPKWQDEGNGVISTKQLENVLLQPGESKTVEVIFTWINGSENLALKTNIVEISEDKNEYDVPDRDSTPDNKQDGEDDIDIAKVILAISTGAVKTYFTLALGLLAVIATGVVLIKKFVL